ncbi:MAG: glucose ABC transporter substrate-binding protein GlcS [Acidilobus sp.]
MVYEMGMRSPPRRSISTTMLAVIIVVVVVVIAVAGAVAYVATKKPVTVTTTVTSTTSSVVTTTTTTTTTTPVTTTTTTPSKITLEFYTWWAATGKLAYTHLIPVFESMYPKYTVEPYVAPGGGGVNAKYVIIGMIEAGKPPAMFQSHSGPEQASYPLITPGGVKAYINFTPVLIKEGAWAAMVPAVRSAITLNGTSLIAPTNIHMGAILYINLKILKEYNLPIPTNLSGLIYDTNQLAAHGFTNIWMIPGAGGGWDQLNVWEDIFLALAIQKYGLHGGAELYNEFVYGTIDLSNSSILQLINETSQVFLQFVKFDVPGWQSLSWQPGAAELAAGQAVFQANGGWVGLYMSEFDNITVYPAVEPYIGWSNVSVVFEPFPGTNGTYAAVIDGISVPVQPPQYAAEEQGALLFAELVTTYSGQSIWTYWKAHSYYDNITSPSFYYTLKQWLTYQYMKSVPVDNWVYQLSDGGLFDDVFESWDGQALALQNSGPSYIPTYLTQLASLMHEECEEWLAAAKIGLGYMGYAGAPLGGYVPPWVIVPGYYFNSSYTCPTYSVP